MSHHGCPERLSNRSKGFQEEGPQPTMEVLVETLTGTAFEMTVSPSDTIFAIKSKICRVEGIPVSQQHLVYNLRELEDASSLRALGIADGARLRLVLGMRGGPISTRRLPPPPEPWRDIERLLDSNREETEWGCGSGSGCKVTVVVFREGERVNMLRVRHNPDGSYSPLHSHYSSSLSQVSPDSMCGSCEACGSCSEVDVEVDVEAEGGALQQNAVTMGKMLDLRRRMESLSIQRHKPRGEKSEMQKTRSEETLSVPSVVEQYGGYEELAPLCEPACDCRCPLQDTDRLKLSGGVSGGLVVSRRERRPRSPDLAALAADYAPLVGGGAGWAGAAARSSSSLHVAGCRRGGGGGGGGGQLLPAPLSSSTPSLARLPPPPPPLARHRHRELLHLPHHHHTALIRPSPPALVSPPAAAAPSPPTPAPPCPAPPPGRKRPRCGWCRKRLSIATLHRCRCGAQFCAPHRYAEVHGCAYDYKAAPTPNIRPTPKLPKI